MSNISRTHSLFSRLNVSLKHTFKISAIALALMPFASMSAMAATSNTQDLNMSRGEYLSHAGDCMACHTNNPDKPYAGGHGLASPLGTIYATNITPDKTYGIGNYTFEDFDNAVRRGTSKNHGSLYPAMPFVSYAKMSTDDIQALYDYFMTEVEPIAEPNLPTDIEWPLNMRFPLAIWNAVIADTTPFIPNNNKSDEWNRGAYLVQGATHCSTCHTPRDITLAEKGTTEASDQFLTGAQLGGWYAPNLRNINMSDEELFILLKEGKNQTHAFAGPMADVTSFSLRHLTDADIQSMIVYLRDIALPQADIPKIGESFNPKTEGYVLYQDFCSTCHGISGEGVKSVAPTLRDRGNGEQGRSLNVAQALLSGAETAHREDKMPYSMPSYAEKFSNEQIADIVNFIMNNKEWNNHNTPITAQDVAELKSQEPAIRGWWVIAGGIIALVVIVGLFVLRRRK